MQVERVPLFQSVAELFLLRYHGRARRLMEAGGDDALRQKGLERHYQLLLKYALDPEFRIAVGGELSADLAKTEWREELGFVLALEVVLARNGFWLYEKILSKERLEELEATYPEVFGRGAGDGPSSTGELLAAAFAPVEGRDASQSALSLVLDSLFPEGFEAKNALLAMRRHGSFLNLEPSWMRELEAFQRYLAADMDKVLSKLGERPEVDIFQARRVRGRNDMVEMIFCIASEAVLLRWFASLDEGTMDRVLSSSTELGWEEGLLLKSIEQRLSWSEDLATGAQAILDAAESYRQYGGSDAALFVYRSLVDNEKVGDRERGEAHNRMAVIHREEGRPHEAFLEFQEAGIIWEGLGARWEGAVTAAFVAEGYGHEGKNDRASKYLAEAFEKLSNASEGDERMARGYFYLAACANAIGQTDMERKALQKGIRFAQSLEDGELFLGFNDRLLDVPK